MARQLPITQVVKSVIQSIGWNADFYFIDQRASSKRYKFWKITPSDEHLNKINQIFAVAGISVQAKRINKSHWSNEECLGIFVSYEHTNLSQEDVDALHIV